MEFKRSENLENFLDCEILKFENEEDRAKKENKRMQEAKQSKEAEYEYIIAEEIAELESRLGELNEDDKEYLEWLKN